MKRKITDTFVKTFAKDFVTAKPSPSHSQNELLELTSLSKKEKKKKKIGHHDKALCYLLPLLVCFTVLIVIVEFNENSLASLFKLPSSLDVLSATADSLCLDLALNKVTISNLELNVAEHKPSEQRSGTGATTTLDELPAFLKGLSYVVDSAVVTAKYTCYDSSSVGSEREESMTIQLKDINSNLAEKRVSAEEVTVKLWDETHVQASKVTVSAEQGFYAYELTFTNTLSQVEHALELYHAVTWNFYKAVFERQDGYNTGNATDFSLVPQKINLNVENVIFHERTKPGHEEKTAVLRKFPENLLIEGITDRHPWRTALLNRLEGLRIGSVSVVLDDFTISVKEVKAARKASDVDAPFFQPPEIPVNYTGLSEEEKEEEDNDDGIISKIASSREDIMSYISKKMKKSGDIDNGHDDEPKVSEESSGKKYKFTTFEFTVESISAVSSKDEEEEEKKKKTLLDPFGLDCRVSVFRTDVVENERKSVAALVKDGSIVSEEDVPVVAIDLNVVGKFRASKSFVRSLQSAVKCFIGIKWDKTLLCQKDLSKNIYTKVESLDTTLTSAVYALFFPKVESKSFRFHFDSFAEEVEVYDEDINNNLCVKGAEVSLVCSPDVPKSISSGVFSRVSKSKIVVKFAGLSANFPGDGASFKTNTKEKRHAVLLADIDPHTKTLSLRLSGLDITMSGKDTGLLEFVKGRLLGPDSVFFSDFISDLENIEVVTCDCKINKAEKIGNTSVSLSSTAQNDILSGYLRWRHMADIIDVQTRFASEKRALEASCRNLTEENKRLQKQVAELQFENLRLKQSAETKNMLVESLSTEKIVRDEHVQMLKKENEELKAKFVFSGLKKSDLEKLRFLEEKNQGLSEAIVESSVKYNKVLNENIGLKSSVANLRRQNEEILALAATGPSSDISFFEEERKKYEAEIQSLKEKTHELAVLSLSFDYLLAKYRTLCTKFYRQNAYTAHKEHTTAPFNFGNSDPALSFPDKKEFMRSGEVNTEVVPMSDEAKESQPAEKQEDQKKSIASIFRAKMFKKEAEKEPEYQQTVSSSEGGFAKKTSLPFYRNMKYVPKVDDSHEKAGNSSNPKEDSGKRAETPKNTNPFVDDDDDNDDNETDSSATNGNFESNAPVNSSTPANDDKKKKDDASTSVFGGFFGAKRSETSESSEGDKDSTTPKKQRSLFGNLINAIKSDSQDGKTQSPSPASPPPLPPKTTQETSAATASPFTAFKDKLVHAFEDSSDDKKEAGDKDPNEGTTKKMSSKDTILSALMADDDNDNDNNNTAASPSTTEDVPPALPPKPPKKRM